MKNPGSRNYFILFKIFIQERGYQKHARNDDKMCKPPCLLARQGARDVPALLVAFLGFEFGKMPMGHGDIFEAFIPRVHVDAKQKSTSDVAFLQR